MPSPPGPHLAAGVLSLQEQPSEAPHPPRHPCNQQDREYTSQRIWKDGNSSRVILNSRSRDLLGEKRQVVPLLVGLRSSPVTSAGLWDPDLLPRPPELPLPQSPSLLPCGKQTGGPGGSPASVSTPGLGPSGTQRRSVLLAEGRDIIITGMADCVCGVGGDLSAHFTVWSFWVPNNPEVMFLCFASNWARTLWFQHILPLARLPGPLPVSPEHVTVDGAAGSSAAAGDAGHSHSSILGVFIAVLTPVCSEPLPSTLRVAAFWWVVISICSF